MENFDPEEVGSMVWCTTDDGKTWDTLDASVNDDGPMIETVHVDDYNRLLALYKELKSK